MVAPRTTSPRPTSSLNRECRYERLRASAVISSSPPSCRMIATRWRICDISPPCAPALAQIAPPRFPGIARANSAPVRPASAASVESLAMESPESALIVPAPASIVTPALRFSRTIPRIPASLTTTLLPRPRILSGHPLLCARRTTPRSVNRSRTVMRRSAGPPTRIVVCSARSASRSARSPTLRSISRAASSLAPHVVSVIHASRGAARSPRSPQRTLVGQVTPQLRQLVDERRLRTSAPLLVEGVQE